MWFNVIVIRASDGETDGTDGTTGTETVVGTGGAAASGMAAGPLEDDETAVVVLVVVVVSARVPSVFTRKTMSTPLRPSAPGSFSAACCRRNSIASRMLASRNSILGMMIVFSLFVIRAVPVASFVNASVIGPTVSPYFFTGSSQPFCTCQSWRERVSLYASSP